MARCTRCLIVRDQHEYHAGRKICIECIKKQRRDFSANYYENKKYTESGFAQRRTCMNKYNRWRKTLANKLVDLQEVAIPALTKHGISMSQYPKSIGNDTLLVSVLGHESGEEVVSEVKIYLQDPTNMQEFGKAMTYMTRYVYKTMIGIAVDEEDDDGESSANPQVGKASEVNKYDNFTVKEWHLKDLKAALSKKPNAKELHDQHLAAYGIKSVQDLKQYQFKEIMEELK